MEAWLIGECIDDKLPWKWAIELVADSWDLVNRKRSINSLAGIHALLAHNFNALDLICPQLKATYRCLTNKAAG